ncbi:unnamed protein product [Miscanthus lutarioriparius]|uniref:Uncharacterized protein n=1 Tax=Miscanthus lutarioriparius TaxID=422564 RepID=A0A811RIF7_9POAL|nr:unnamed protein product [Miscanthus lutarioriparius]
MRSLAASWITALMVRVGWAASVCQFAKLPRISFNPAKKSGRKVTINDQLRKRRAKGKHIDIKFPKEFAKVCGEHASLFKSEITVLVIIAFSGWLLQYIFAVQQKCHETKKEQPGKQEMGSKVGTRSIAQIAYDLRDPETGEWPTAMQVWRATYQKADGTWPIPTGEEIMTKLHEAAGIHQEKISSTPVLIVEHFALVLGQKLNHSRGVGIRAVN